MQCNSLPILISGNDGLFFDRCAINAMPENMDEAYQIFEKFVSSLPGSEDETSDQMDMSFFTTNKNFVPKWCQTHFELPFQVNYVSRSIQTAMYTNPDYARYASHVFHSFHKEERDLIT